MQAILFFFSGLAIIFFDASSENMKLSHIFQAPKKEHLTIYWWTAFNVVPIGSPLDEYKLNRFTVLGAIYDARLCEGELKMIIPEFRE